MDLTLIYGAGVFLTGLIVGRGLTFYYLKRKIESQVPNEMQEMMNGMQEMFEDEENQGGLLE